MTEHTATIVPASELARRRAERDRQRQEQLTFAGSILEQEDNTSAPALPAQMKDTKR